MNRLRVALYLARASGWWEALDYVFGCRVGWVCRRYERTLP